MVRQRKDCVVVYVTLYCTDDVSAAGRLDLSFGPTALSLTTDFVYDVVSAVNNNGEVEADEGFILYFNFNESEIEPIDLTRLEAGNRTILVTILDDDSELSGLDQLHVHTVGCAYVYCSRTSDSEMS